MINVRSIRKLTNNDGLTLRAGRIIRYKTGWQVATEGVECSTPEEAMEAIGKLEIFYSEDWKNV